MTLFLKKDYPVKWIRTGNLSVVWAQAQRGLRESKVETIMEEFDPDAVGVVAVTQPNGKGHYHVVDGQHRVEAVRRTWGESERVPCLVLSASDPAEAADVWLKINSDRTKPQAIDRFRVAVTAGREDEVAVNDLLLGLGYRIGGGMEDGTINCVTACLSIYRKHGPGVLKDAFLVLQAMWGKDRDSVHNNIVRGTAMLLGEYGTQVDRKRLVDKVVKQYTPAALIGAAKSWREFHRGTISKGVCNVLIAAYNHGLQADKRIQEIV